MAKQMHTVAGVGRRPFHLASIEMEGAAAKLHIIVAIDNAPEAWDVEYSPPDDFIPVVQAMARSCPMHMVGFEGEYLADARTVWGYVCPCGL